MKMVFEATLRRKEKQAEDEARPQRFDVIGTPIVHPYDAHLVMVNAGERVHCWCVTGSYVVGRERSGHTPGPWEVSSNGIDEAGADIVVRRVRIQMERSKLGNAVDDVRLIASAPELLEAAQNVLKSFATSDSAFDDLQAVVAKTRGERVLSAANEERIQRTRADQYERTVKEQRNQIAGLHRKVERLEREDPVVVIDEALVEQRHRDMALEIQNARNRGEIRWLADKLVKADYEKQRLILKAEAHKDIIAGLQKSLREARGQKKPKRGKHTASSTESTLFLYTAGEDLDANEWATFDNRTGKAVRYVEPAAPANVFVVMEDILQGELVTIDRSGVRKYKP